MSDNHYDVLGVEPTASRDELRDAYRARVDELTAARERKGITERQLQDNRDEVARVRSAWNVLSDPFQRQRYDTQAEAGVDDASGSSGGTDGAADDGAEAPAPLTGWRRLMAPPPPKPATGSGSGRQPPPARPVREPTIPLPPGMHIAQPRVRGMALLFDLSIVIVLFYAINILLPPVLQSDYSTIRDQVTIVNDAKSAQGDIDDAQKSVKDANAAVSKAEASGNQKNLDAAQEDLENAESDLRSAQRDFAKAQRDYNEKQADRDLPRVSLPQDTDQLQSLSDALSDKIQGTAFLAAGITLAAALLYLVPITAISGHTLGMRRRNLKVVRIDGSPVGWWQAFARFLVPLLFGVVGFVTVLGLLGPIVAFGIVLWGYRDPNGQGVHDKLARTLVVDA